MALQKVLYEDGKTVITAENMNKIQDEIIANQREIEDLKTQGAASSIVPATVE